MRISLVIIFGLILGQGTLVAKTITVKSGKSIQEAVLAASSGDTILVTPGTYRESVYIDKPNIRLVGIVENGQRPLLDGESKRHDGIIASGSGFQVMNFYVKNFKGNGVTSQGADDVVMKNLIVESTGIYGIYPTHGTNVVIENTITSGISDAGIYVSMCHHVDVKHNEVYANVAGIEIENSHNVLVENNFAHDNASGIMAFTLPGLPEKTSGNIVIRKNMVVNNNHPNFANPTAVVGSVPRGTGMIILAGNDVKIENNIVRNNDTAGIIFSDMDYIGDSTAPDPEVNPRYDNNKVLRNLFVGNGSKPEGKVKLLLAALHFRLSGGDIIAHGKGQNNCLHPEVGGEGIGTKLFQRCSDGDSTQKTLSMLEPKASAISPNSLQTSVGERVYRTVCSGCHASGIVLIGPSIQTLQQKYPKNAKGIAEFAYEPVKIRSKFPPMPSHSYLGKEKLLAVAEYILKLAK